MRLFLFAALALSLAACDSSSDDGPDDSDPFVGTYVGTYTRLDRDNPGQSPTNPARLDVLDVEADGDFNFTLTLTLGGAPQALTGEGQIDGSALTMTLDDGNLLAYTALTGTVSSTGRTVSLRAERGDTYVLERVER